MGLPKINTPVFFITIPSTGVELKFRPFLVKEEKILLIAQQSGDSNSIFAIKQIINNCCLDTIDADTLTTFDIEYIFLKLRARSVDNISKLRFRDTEDSEIYEFEVNLDDIEIIKDPNHTSKIQINDEVGIILKYPNVNLAEKMGDITDQGDVLSKILVHSIDSIYDTNTVYPSSEYTEIELLEFLEGLDTKTFKKIENFFTTMPKLYHEIKYTNKLGHERKITLSSITDFFT